MCTERESDRIAVLKQERLEQIGYKCEVCGEPIWPGHFAHRIPQEKWAFELYGEDKVHHPLNLVLVCGDTCNRSVNIRNNPVECDRLISEIEEALSDE